MHTLKSRRTQNEYFSSRRFFFENEQREAFTVNGDRYRARWNNFCAQKLKRRILATFNFNRTALRATQPKLDLMFYALFLKIVVVQQVVCWLIRRKARVRVSGQISKRNAKSISSAISSPQISGKNFESKLNCHDKVFQKICRSELTLNCRSRHLFIKIDTHNISSVRNQANNPD